MRECACVCVWCGPVLLSPRGQARNARRRMSTPEACVVCVRVRSLLVCGSCIQGVLVRPPLPRLLCGLALPKCYIFKSVHAAPTVDRWCGPPQEARCLCPTEPHALSTIPTAHPRTLVGEIAVRHARTWPPAVKIFDRRPPRRAVELRALSMRALVTRRRNAKAALAQRLPLLSAGTLDAPPDTAAIAQQYMSTHSTVASPGPTTGSPGARVLGRSRPGSALLVHSGQNSYNGTSRACEP